ncbi:hypothetical protein FUA23_16710 [Neolewinella aurantiaca]|uniref:Ig-like domain-containing protein n=1 Tax=Neolewinella aurantiaca TaxID=2602767 RepID=A0A5C7FER5_9BACT|nr:gliding motility-associated C-terminal domain-containing protein [Neolewinella aurantiaca]TXF88001.1 hypothetical protein FUA23_16710 [Neolewinella aurantiaca]
MSFLKQVLIMLFIGSVNLIAQDDPRLVVNDAIACSTNTVSVAVTTEGFVNVIDIVFNLDWNTDSLELIDVIYPQQDDLPLGYQYNEAINKFSFSSTDLISSPLSDTTTLMDGDTLLILHFNVRARSAEQVIQSTFFSALFSLMLFNDSGTLAETDITIVPGVVSIETSCEPEHQSEPNLYIGSVAACKGDTIKIPVTVDNFARVIDMIFSLDWNADSLKFIEVDYPQGDNLPINYQVNDQLGKYLFASTDLINSPINDTTTLRNGDTLLCLRFEVLAETTSQTVQSTFTPGLFNLILYESMGELEELDITINPGTVTLNSEVINFTVQPDTISCEHPQAELLAVSENQGTTFTWYQNGALVAEGAEFLTNDSGVFNVVAENEAACQSESQVEVSIDTIMAQPQVQGGVITCRVDSVQLNAIDLQVNYSYSWRNTSNVLSNGPTHSVTEPGLYNLVSINTDNGCRDTSFITVDIDTIPPEIELMTGEITCSQLSVPLAFSSATPNLLSTWRTNGGVPLPTPTAQNPGVYSVIITNPINGCTILDSVLVRRNQTPPAYSVSEQGQVILNCRQTEETISVDYEGDYSIAWSDEPGTITATNDSILITAPGEVLLIVTNNDNGCKDSTRLSVIAETQPPAVNIVAPVTFNCNLGTAFVEIMGSNTSSYEWSHLNGGTVAAVTSDSFLVVLPGRLILKTTDNLTGCQRSDTIVINSASDQLAFSGLIIDPGSCNSTMDASLMLGEGRGGTGPYTYTFEGQNYLPFQIIEDLAPGSYELTINDSGNCSKDTVLVLEPAEELQFSIIGNNQTVALGETIEMSLSGGFNPDFTYTIDWMTSDTTCTGCETFSLNPQQTDDFTVNIFRSDGCSQVLSGGYIVDRRPDIYLPTAFSPNGDGINDNLIPLYGPQVEKITEFLIYDRWGKECYRFSTQRGFYPEGWNGIHNGKSSPPGAYVAIVTFRLSDGTPYTLSQSFNLLR